MTSEAIMKLATERYGYKAIPGLRTGLGAFNGKVLLVLLAYHNARIVAFGDTAEELLGKLQRGEVFTSWCHDCQYPMGHDYGSHHTGHRPTCFVPHAGDKVRR